MGSIDRNRDMCLSSDEKTNIQRLGLLCGVRRYSNIITLLSLATLIDSGSKWELSPSSRAAEVELWGHDVRNGQPATHQKALDLSTRITYPVSGSATSPSVHKRLSCLASKIMNVSTETYLLFTFACSNFGGRGLSGIPALSMM